MNRKVMCGDVAIGGGEPCSIQSMTNTDTRDVPSTVKQIKELEKAGCRIIRLAVPDMQAAEAFSEIKKSVGIPMVADIHFDHRLAIAAMKNGADKIRINPGNIGSRDNVAAVVKEAKERNIPIRVGVNSGSLEKDILERDGGVTAAGLVESALRQVTLLEDMDFEDIVISLKSSDVKMNTQAYMMISEKTDHPLHIGVTEAGTPDTGKIKSAVGIGSLLLAGIGDTMRVSLTGDPVEEVITAKKILAAAGLRKEPIDIVSCPTCGRTGVDLVGIVSRIERGLADVVPGRSITVAVMGCEVNGPGEAGGADIGVACGKGRGLIFAEGKTVKTVDEDDIVPEIIRMVEKI